MTSTVVSSSTVYPSFPVATPVVAPVATTISAFTWPSEEATLEHLFFTLAEYAINKYLVLISAAKNSYKVEKTEHLNVLQNTRIIWSLLRKLPSHKDVPFHLRKKVGIISYLAAFDLSCKIDKLDIKDKEIKQKLAIKMHDFIELRVLIILNKLIPIVPNTKGPDQKIKWYEQDVTLYLV